MIIIYVNKPIRLTATFNDNQQTKNKQPTSLLIILNSPSYLAPVLLLFSVLAMTNQVIDTVKQLVFDRSTR